DLGEFCQRVRAKVGAVAIAEEQQRVIAAPIAQAYVFACVPRQSEVLQFHPRLDGRDTRVWYQRLSRLRRVQHRLTQIEENGNCQQEYTDQYQSKQRRSPA